MHFRIPVSAATVPSRSVWPGDAFGSGIPYSYFLFLFISFVATLLSTHFVRYTRKALLFQRTSLEGAIIEMRTSAQGFQRILFQFAAAAVILAASAIGCRVQDKNPPPSGTPQQEIKYSQDPDAAKKMTLLLKDFDPKSMLHAQVHEVPRAKFPAIDVHNHVDDAGGVHEQDIPAEEVVRRMDAANVEKIVILTGMWGDKLQSVLEIAPAHNAAVGIEGAGQALAALIGGATGKQGRAQQKKADEDAAHR